jgi:putative ABC transport system ATP-binding protein
VLNIQSLSKTFFIGTVDEIVALQHVSLTLNAGDFATIIGSNGAGKSTLLNVIAGVHACDSGRIILDDEDITRYPEHRRARLVARVFQDPKQGTAALMSIEEHLAMARTRGRRYGLHWGVTAQLRRQFRDSLAVLNMGLEDRLRVPVGTLSGGQRQALALLMAAIQPPSLLLLDEHTAGLDPQAAARILQLTDSLVHEHRLTSLMVTHHLEHAIRYGNRLMMMHQGRIALDIVGDEKRSLTVADLIRRFEKQIGKQILDDRLLLRG